MTDEIRWEWKGDPPSVDDVKTSLESLPAVFGLEIVRYADFVLPMTRRQEIQQNGRGTGQYEIVTKLYMQVAGRVKMLADMVRRWGWAVEETEEFINGPGETWVMKMGVRINGLIPFLESGKWTVDYPAETLLLSGRIEGVRYGIAKIRDGNAEKMETGARGRALGAWGIGILPGSGIASLDEMEAFDAEVVYGEGRPPQEPSVELDREVLEESIVLRVEQLRQINSVGGTEVTIEAAHEGLIAYVKKNLGKGITVQGGQLDFGALGNGQLKLIDQRLDGWILEAKDKATS